MNDFEESLIIYHDFGTSEIAPSPSPAHVYPDSMTELIRRWEELLATWRAEDALRTLPPNPLPPSAGDLDDPRPWQPILSAPLLEEMSDLNDEMADGNGFADGFMYPDIENVRPFTWPVDISDPQSPPSNEIDWEEAFGFDEIDLQNEPMMNRPYVEERNELFDWENKFTVGWLLDG